MHERAYRLLILLGTAMLRAIMGMKPCDADRQFVERRLAAVFMAALSNDG